ncbi:MAG TPA: hypothetical protein VEQ63_01425, partial [Bryobacteraceae bacterium]|nr:hypothetical protein [Bryobacteraceae bacterium]
MNLSWLALLSASAVLAQSSPVSRQGAYWVQTETQAVGVMRGSRLRVQTKGSVIFTGKEGTRGSVTVVKRVRARTESEARTLLSAAVLQTTLARHSGRVRLSMPQRSPIAAEMQITAPANLAEVVVETQGGEVQIRNVEGRVSAESGGGPILLDRIGGDAIGRTAGGDIRLG